VDVLNENEPVVFLFLFAGYGETGVKVRGESYGQQQGVSAAAAVSSSGYHLS